MTTDAQVREFLRRLRAPAPEIMRAVFTRGGCYALYEILAGVWPEAIAFQTCRNSKLTGEHVVTWIDGRVWDITGEREWHTTRMRCFSQWKDMIRVGKRIYRRMTPAECRKARKWSPVVWDQVVKR